MQTASPLLASSHWRYRSVRFIARFITTINLLKSRFLFGAIDYIKHEKSASPDASKISESLKELVIFVRVGL